MVEIAAKETRVCGGGEEEIAKEEFRVLSYRENDERREDGVYRK